MNHLILLRAAGRRAVSSRMRAVAAFAVIAAVGAPSLRAQAAAPAADKPDEVVKLSEFVTTGSRFNDRTVTDSPVPIDVISRSDLEKGGYSETSQMLQSLVPSFNFPRPSLTDGTDHIRPATLRGLAPDQTLVLINGKRRHTSALVNLNGSIGRGSVSTDFNVIPSSAIERIEVLRDGASAQYGSDAIAGVINVILRKDIGWGLDESYGANYEGDGRDLKISGYAGTALGEKGTLFLTAWYREHSPSSRIAVDTRQQYFGTNPATGALTPLSGNFGSGTGLSPSNGTLDPREATANRLNHRFGDPRSKEKGVWFNGDYPLTEDTTFYFFGGWSNKHGEAAGFFRRPGDDRTIRAIYPNGFLPKIQSSVDDLSFGTGLKGRAGEWNWDLSTTFGYNQLDYFTTESINDTLGAASPRSFYDGLLKFRQSTTNLDLTRSFNTGLTSPLKAAFGLEFRSEGYKIGIGEPDSFRDGGVRILDGPAAGTIGGSAPGAQVFSGFTPADIGSFTRDAKAVYVDFEQNLTERWLVSLAGRFEDYSDFGSKSTGKLASRYEFSKAIAVRGSVSTGFRAPHLAQESFAATSTNNIGGTLQEVRTLPVNNPIAIALGATALKPETSTSQSIGFTTQPVANLTTTVDLYETTIKDRIVLSSNFAGIGAFLTSQGLPSVGVARFFTNAVDTRTRGVDATVRYIWKTTDLGKFTFTAGYNHNETKVTRFKPTPPQLSAPPINSTTPLFDLTEKIRMERGQPRDVLNLSVAYDVKKFSFLLREVRYGEVASVALGNNTGLSPAAQAALLPGYNVELVDPVVNVASGNKQVVQIFGAKWLTDFDITYHWSKHLSVSAGANNLFDVYPDEAIRSRVVNGVAFNGADNAGSLPYVGSLSPFGYSGAFYYTKVSYKF
ncbi:MAG: TonB-dependent receptor [Opitutae bacterium]|nr:TonB-dependent receptor [Opitutae bacterium]